MRERNEMPLCEPGLIQLFTFNTPGLEVDMFNEMDLPPEGYGRNNHNPSFYFAILTTTVS